jgi:hypothetical protein
MYILVVVVDVCCPNAVLVSLQLVVHVDVSLCHILPLKDAHEILPFVQQKNTVL